MNDVFIVEARRTPFGSFGGVLSEMPATELASQVIQDLLQRQPIPGEAINEVIIGQVLQGGAAKLRRARRCDRLASRTAFTP